MCRFASAFFSPDTMDVKVWDLNYHANTEEHLRLSGTWREMHYEPNGSVECRVLPEDPITSAQAVDQIRKQWPRFVDFLSWAVANGAMVGEILDLGSLTSAVGLTIPPGVTYLDLADSVRQQLATQQAVSA
jgi:hypothetical protein